MIIHWQFDPGNRIKLGRLVLLVGQKLALEAVEAEVEVEAEFSTLEAREPKLELLVQFEQQIQSTDDVALDL
jgi:hypothetical protein